MPLTQRLLPLVAAIVLILSLFVGLVVIIDSVDPAPIRLAAAAIIA